MLRQNEVVLIQPLSDPRGDAKPRFLPVMRPWRCLWINVRQVVGGFPRSAVVVVRLLGRTLLVGQSATQAARVAHFVGEI